MIFESITPYSRCGSLDTQQSARTLFFVRAGTKDFSHLNSAAPPHTESLCSLFYQLLLGLCAEKFCAVAIRSVCYMCGPYRLQRATLSNYVIELLQNEAVRRRMNDVNRRSTCLRHRAPITRYTLCAMCYTCARDNRKLCAAVVHEMRGGRTVANCDGGIRSRRDTMLFEPQLSSPPTLAAILIIYGNLCVCWH